MSLGHILAHLFSMSHVTEPHISALVFNVSGTKLYSFYFLFFSVTTVRVHTTPRCATVAELQNFTL